MKGLKGIEGFRAFKPDIEAFNLVKGWADVDLQ